MEGEYSLDKTLFLSNVVFHEIEKLKTMKNNLRDSKQEKREIIRSMECIIDNTVDIIPISDAKRILQKKLYELELEERTIAKNDFK